MGVSARADLDAYAGSYLQQEIVAEGAMRNVPAFSRSLRVAALCNGTIVNFTNLANDAQVARTTVYEYFEILKDTLVLHELPAWRQLTGPRRQHMDWQQHRLIIHGKGGPYGARSKRRVVPLSARVRALLEPHFSLHDRFGMCPRTVQRLVKRVANRAAVLRPVTPHILRHTFAVTAVQKGISLPSLQRVLGHEYLGTTQIYLNMSPEDVLNEFQRKW